MGTIECGVVDHLDGGRGRRPEDICSGSGWDSLFELGAQREPEPEPEPKGKPERDLP